jgi:hypothetical protein
MRYMLLVLVFLLCGCGAVVNVPIPELKPGILPKVNPNWASGIDSIFLYSYAICVVIIAACIAVLVWVPIPNLRKLALMGITFAGCLMAMGITFAIIKPFIPIVVLGSVVIGAAIGIWYIVANFDALRQVIHKDQDALTSGAQNLVNVCQNLPPTK